MKNTKIRLMLFGVLVSLVLFGNAMSETNDEEREYNYLAVTSGYSPYSRIPGIPSNVTDTSQVIQVRLIDAWSPVPLLLPEGSEHPERYAFVAIYVTLSERLSYEYVDSVEILKMPSGVLAPERVEIIGPIRYGTIVHLDEDSLTVSAYNRDVGSTGESSTYKITPSTRMIAYQETFDVGTIVEMIVDSNDTVLAIMVYHG